MNGTCSVVNGMASSEKKVISRWLPTIVALCRVWSQSPSINIPINSPALQRFTGTHMDSRPRDSRSRRDQ